MKATVEVAYIQKGKGGQSVEKTLPTCTDAKEGGAPHVQRMCTRIKHVLAQGHQLVLDCLISALHLIAVRS